MKTPSGPIADSAVGKSASAHDPTIGRTANPRIGIITIGSALEFDDGPDAKLIVGEIRACDRAVVLPP